jgi:hypothetical protein
VSIALLQVGGGSLTRPFVAMEKRVNLATATSVTWDVTSWVRTAARVNDLKLVVRSLDPEGGLALDQVYLKVTYGPTRAKSTTGFPVTLFVTNGWDSQELTTLAASGEVSIVNAVDGERAEIAAGSFASYQFQRVPANVVIRSATVHVRHFEEEGFAPGKLAWRVAGGTLRSPTTLTQRIPAVLSGELSEATVPWDVSGTINSVTRVNILKFVARNNDLSESTMIDRVHVVVTHREP